MQYPGSVACVKLFIVCQKGEGKKDIHINNEALL